MSTRERADFTRMRYLITGARGFIGAAVVRAALRAGHDVSVLVRYGSEAGRLAEVADDVTWIGGDLSALDASATRAACESFSPNVVIHAGWEGVLGADRNTEWQTTRNVPAALALVMLAADCGAEHFVGLGSQAEYGLCDGRINEEHVLNPTTLYGAAKVSAAAVTKTAAELRDISHTWLRVFSTYGAGGNASWILPMAANAMARGVAPALTKCEQRWEFLHVDDAASAVLAVVSARAAGTFNLGSGEAHVLRDVILALRDRINRNIEPIFGAAAYRPDQVMHLEADITRLHSATGWLPAIVLSAGLDAIAEEALHNNRSVTHA